jgi:hypothetical protein
MDRISHIIDELRTLGEEYRHYKRNHAGKMLVCIPIDSATRKLERLRTRLQLTSNARVKLNYRQLSKMKDR